MGRWGRGGRAVGPSPLPLAQGLVLAALRRDLSPPGGNILTQRGGFWAALRPPRRQSSSVQGAAVGHLLTSLG